MQTAHYGLNHLAKIKAGDKVLIHTAAGGVGLIAVQIALNKGAETYATASKGKQQYLRELGIKHVYDSRNTDFGEEILKDTHAQGVDIVLNMLTSEGFKEASLNCLKQGGVFLEISKRNIYTLDEMKKIRPDVQYYVIAVDNIIVESPKAIEQLMKELVEMLGQGIIKPPYITRYPIEQLPIAMRDMQQAKQIGKIVITQPLPLIETISPESCYI